MTRAELTMWSRVYEDRLLASDEFPMAARGALLVANVLIGQGDLSAAERMLERVARITRGPK